MLKSNEVINHLKEGKYNNTFSYLYGSENVSFQASRYLEAVEAFEKEFGTREICLISTPGRSEVGGNHTDHNGGRVLCAAVNLDVIAVVCINDEYKVDIISEGYDRECIDLNDLSKHENEKYKSSALIRGVSYRLKELGYNIGGFCAYITSNVLKGSGLSSSAAYEVNLVSIYNILYNEGKIPLIENAKISQYAENEYFQKPCGLMDQTACAVGGFVTIDFEDFENPGVEKIDYDFAKAGYSMCVIDTGGNHADLNEDYYLLEHEMKQVAKLLGGDVLRRCSKEQLLSNISYLRENVSDRAIARALHFFDDDMRVEYLIDALKKNNFERFNEIIIESGESSFMFCQNAYAISVWQEQPIVIGLIIAKNVLLKKGSYRLHGGGFAGTIQAFVPDELFLEFKEKMTGVFGEKAFYKLMIRPVGTTEIVCD